ncbi:hypothetical protein AVEN_219427-1 [Araneus ventricosus]|uniref:Uncharacterized protein n=1 Tax=Araneus ventricosus TaxID=182803 RepID=A0A4Y2P8C8_ARAVE|nr:hypothetical protein AVEN_219427-1 [Araneus ventricosus]
MNDQLPRQIVRHCDFCIIAPIRSGSCNSLRFTRVRPVIGVGPKSHITISAPIREARSCLLIRQLLLRALAVPPMGLDGRDEHPQTGRREFVSSQTSISIAVVQVVCRRVLLDEIGPTAKGGGISSWQSCGDVSQ